MRGTRGQSKALLEHMKTKGPITSMEAFQLYGITRISSLVFSLRKNHNIETVMVHTTNRYGEPCQYGRFYYAGEKNIGKGNKGKVRSDEWKRKHSDAIKGKSPWNKGLTANDPRVAKKHPQSR